MTQYHRYTFLYGRSVEIARLRSELCTNKRPALLVVGPSGIGKTAVVETFSSLISGEGRPFHDVWTQSLYRTSWTSALAALRTKLPHVPRNATATEIEEALLQEAQRRRLLVVLDNVEAANASAASHFVDRWTTASHESSILLTAQPPIEEQFSRAAGRLPLEGIKNDGDIISLLGPLSERFPPKVLLDVGNVVGRNPQRLLFLRAMDPADEERLRRIAENLASNEPEAAIEDLVDKPGAPSLFFLVLGLHRDFVVSEALLAWLWDHFGSRGAEAYIANRDFLVDKAFLLPTEPNSYRLHESVHVQLEKALIHRVGTDRLPSLHHYFAEFYRRALRNEPTTRNLSQFVHHALGARDLSLAFSTVVVGDAADRLGRGSAAHLRQEIERVLEHLAVGTSELGPLEIARIYLRLGRLCNDLSDHNATLEYMARLRETIGDIAAAVADAQLIERESWYYTAVSYSNLGMSDLCLKYYFRLVRSSASEDDMLGCVSLGYLAQDLKYRDLPLAVELGRMAVRWAAEYGDPVTLGKNLCSVAESQFLAEAVDQAIAGFDQAARLAQEQANRRELGRVLTNWGFVECALGDLHGLERLDEARELSSSVGDRRRELQAILYTGVGQAVKGDFPTAVECLTRAATGLRDLSDGRYFVPALRWLIQVATAGTADYPFTGEFHVGSASTRLSYPSLYSYAQNRPEFAVYHEFWSAALRPILANRLAGG